MEQVRARLSAEDRLVEHRLNDVDLHCAYLFTAGRKITTPRLAPGTAPRTSIKFSSERISTTSKFCVESCSCPQCPPTFFPLRTRPEYDRFRIDPPWRKYSCVPCEPGKPANDQR